MQYGKLFEEDREYNQGDFAEAVREQAVTERAEYFVNLQMALSEISGYEAEATRAHIVAALQSLDPDISERQAGPPACSLPSLFAASPRLLKGGGVNSEGVGVFHTREAIRSGSLWQRGSLCSPVLRSACAQDAWQAICASMFL